MKESCDVLVSVLTIFGFTHTQLLFSRSGQAFGFCFNLRRTESCTSSVIYSHYKRLCKTLLAGFPTI